MRCVIPIFLLFIFVSFDGKAQLEDGNRLVKWIKLGHKAADMSADHDEIPVGIEDGYFTAFKFKVADAPLYIFSIRIFYGNGDMERYIVNANFEAGTVSKIFDLPANQQLIKKIVVNHKSIRENKGNAVIEIWGRR